MRNVRTRPLSFSGSPAIRWLFLLSAAAAHPGLTSAAEVPKNLAVEARVSASSQFSDDYAPTRAISGEIPSDLQPTGGRLGGAWHAERLVRAAMGPAGRGGPDRLLRADHQPAAGGFQGLCGLCERPAGTRRTRHAGTPPRPAEDRLAKAGLARLRIEFLSSHPEAQNPGAARSPSMPRR